MGKTVQVNLAKITHKSFGKENPLDVIYDGLKGNVVVSSRSFLYHFKHVELLSVPETRFIYGELYKSKLSSKHDVLTDKETLTYDPEIIDELFAISKFIIFSDLSIAFTSSHRIDDDSFLKYFKQLYHRNAAELFSKIQIHYQKDDIDIFKKINSFSRLVEVMLINIRKSNPCPKPTFDKIEALLDKEKTDVLTARFKSEKPAGLSRALDSHIMSGISIADSGYGDSIILGQNVDGNFEKIRLKDRAIKKRIDELATEEKTFFARILLKIFAKYIHSEDDLVND
jgi:hypothetical protein